MKTCILFPALLLLLSACNGDSPATKVTNTDSTAAEQEPITECYAYLSGKDTISLHVTRQGRNVTGELHYAIFEKDRNSGSIRGQMHGDTLLAEYTFSSEGIESVREIAFLKKENGLAEGYGEAEEKDGRLVFKNAGALQFSNTVILTRSDCR